MIVWSDRLSIGIHKIDRQHQRLIAMINDLSLDQHTPADAELMADVLGRMMQYAAYHFKTEERVMMEYGYPDYPRQVEEHAEFRSRAASFCDQSLRADTRVSAEVFAYLQKWLVTHIVESDLGFRDFLVDNGYLPARKPVGANSCTFHQGLTE
jgi:hemerythrin-like metal-binding protein